MTNDLTLHHHTETYSWQTPGAVPVVLPIREPGHVVTIIPARISVSVVNAVIDRVHLSGLVEGTDDHWTGDTYARDGDGVWSHAPEIVVRAVAETAALVGADCA
ncbi:hypothetical protein SEA_LILBEANIE_76 [Gordonia phage Lilbeanie]|uniref:Uncharacterized protein n=1 Tax=Gordonia phage Lilbeanie TaxID=2794947 RepID=A0A7T1KSC0_9CAUD|nr:hypothetical protein J1773_gp76 [Gordonia phage Lilbeanie]QPO17154.1 hypothetical protein SEA_LILBEANIE_76 [Gordonia phage Lilbeanie]